MHLYQRPHLAISLKSKAVGIKPVTLYRYGDVDDIAGLFIYPHGTDENRLAPAITVGEAIHLLFYFGYAVCVRMDDGMGWATDEFHTIQYHIEEAYKDHFNEADILGGIIIRMVEFSFLNADTINAWLETNTKKILKEFSPYDGNINHKHKDEM